jgi:predicted GNAT family acetyltransferase
MRLEAHPDAGAFLAEAAPVIAADEARHNLIYGICSTVLEIPSVYEEAHFWTVHDDGIVAAALMTPPFNVVVARPLAPEALPYLARALREQAVALPGVTGAIPEADLFAAAWEEAAGAARRVQMRQGIYAARSASVPEGVPGAWREAGHADRELALAWLRAFEAEAMHGSAARPDHAEWFDRRLGSTTAGLSLWEHDSQVVSMCGYGGPTPHGIRIGPVYTPPELRRRGYASALVAQVTQHLLDGGRDYCFLYTDLANPTSNRIYMSVGYELVCESAEYSFD